MLIHGLLCLISSLPLLVIATAPGEFQSVQFVPNDNSAARRDVRSTGKTRSSRRATLPHAGADISDYFSFTLAQPDVEVWTPSSNDIRFDVHNNGHITPDFSDGLSYPDPFLLVGPAAKRAAAYLYSRHLFFGDIPHQRAVAHNQEMRRRNGLSGNRLGSLNPRSPWSRFGSFDVFGIVRGQDRGGQGFRLQF